MLSVSLHPHCTRPTLRAAVARKTKAWRPSGIILRPPNNASTGLSGELVPDTVRDELILKYHSTIEHIVLRDTHRPALLFLRAFDANDPLPVPGAAATAFSAYEYSYPYNIYSNAI